MKEQHLTSFLINKKTPRTFNSAVGQSVELLLRILIDLITPGDTVYYELNTFKSSDISRNGNGYETGNIVCGYNTITYVVRVYKPPYTNFL